MSYGSREYNAFCDNTRRNYFGPGGREDRKEYLRPGECLYSNRERRAKARLMYRKMIFIQLRKLSPRLRFRHPKGSEAGIRISGVRTRRVYRYHINRLNLIHPDSVEKNTKRPVHFSPVFRSFYVFFSNRSGALDKNSRTFSIRLGSCSCKTHGNYMFTDAIQALLICI